MAERKRTVRNVTLRDSMFDGHNIWLLKPADANRGRGVQLFSSIDQLKRLILEFTTVNKAEAKVSSFGQTPTANAAYNATSELNDVSTSASEKTYIPG